MKRWRWWLLLTLLACIPILLSRSSDPSLLADTDTAFLLKQIRQRHAPMSWFTGDWPLGNHFYRPLPTLAFELDNALYGANPTGYGWTNALLCACCVIALFWLLLETTLSPPMAGLGASLFAGWTVGFGGQLGPPLLWVAALLPIVGLYRHGFIVTRYLPASLVLVFLAFELGGPEVNGQHGFSGAALLWLPGRTATMMTFFCLVAMAAYVRFERARSLPAERPPASTDVPIGMREEVKSGKGRPARWITLSLLAGAAAFATYEQAVMLPACILGLAVYLRWRRFSPSWKAVAGFWLLLAAYLAMRALLISAAPSAYQAQQFRHGPGVTADLLGYAAPFATDVRLIWLSLSSGLIMILDQNVLIEILVVASLVTVAFQARRSWKLVAVGWALSLIAFLPMAWMKPFGHYHYWPMALRTLFLLGVAQLSWNLLSIAVCPPSRQAPPRPSPAPGSLPRR